MTQFTRRSLAALAGVRSRRDRRCSHCPLPQPHVRAGAGPRHPQKRLPPHAGNLRTRRSRLYCAAPERPLHRPAPRHQVDRRGQLRDGLPRPQLGIARHRFIKGSRRIDSICRSWSPSRRDRESACGGSSSPAWASSARWAMGWSRSGAQAPAPRHRRPGRPLWCQLRTGLPAPGQPATPRRPRRGFLLRRHRPRRQCLQALLRRRRALPPATAAPARAGWSTPPSASPTGSRSRSPG